MALVVRAWEGGGGGGLTMYKTDAVTPCDSV